jgi:hypothetical protein
MKRPVSFTAKLALAVAALLAAGAAGAGGGLSPSAGSKRAASNAFNVLQNAPLPSGPVILPSYGTAIPPGKAVVTNPYAVPLFQNAGALGPLR